ncbi:unnamed protein product [Brassica rapa subsp. trilocularis]
MKAAKLRTKDVTFYDRVSHLPDDLLFRIISLIPISDAMHTSLLSKVLVTTLVPLDLKNFVRGRCNYMKLQSSQP